LIEKAGQFFCPALIAYGARFSHRMGRGAFMKAYLKNIIAVGFLVLFLPYTVTLLVNGRQGIHQEERLPDLEYQVLYQLLSQDFSWMEDETLKLMAVLYRTEYVRDPEAFAVEEISPKLYGESYERLCRAVEQTQGQVITIAGEYRELPYHAVSAGSTRKGQLLGEDFSYVLPVECPDDLYSDAYLQVCYLTEEELAEAMGEEFSLKELALERDEAEYVTSVSCGENSWTGENFRTLLHLPSSCFWLEPLENSVRITVKGSGHGFGISLYTANCMALEGAGFMEIIHKFYQNAECITIS